MKYVIILFLLLWLQTGICQKSNKSAPQKPYRILEIDYDNGGGEPGFSITLRIRPDSTFYCSNTFNYRRVKKKLDIKTQTQNWNKLISLLNLSEFDKTPSGQRQRDVDGIDTRIYIKTSDKIHFLIVDKHLIKNYKSVNDLLTQLLNQVRELDITSKQ
jgi:hypothetical protein